MKNTYKELILKKANLNLHELERQFKTIGFDFSASTNSFCKTVEDLQFNTTIYSIILVEDYQQLLASKNNKKIDFVEVYFHAYAAGTYSFIASWNSMNNGKNEELAKKLKKELSQIKDFLLS